MKMTKKGFTLVEMLIVIVIIGILAAAVLPKLMGAQDRARDTARRSDINQLNTAIQSYNLDYGRYFSGTTVKKCYSTVGGSATYTGTKISTLSGALKEYMSSVPIKGPNDENDDYYACKLRNGYLLYAKMETIGGGNHNNSVGSGIVNNSNELLNLIKPTDKNNSWYFLTYS